MKAIWEFFEELDEMVYVSDVETNDIIYMNAHLRNTLGYSSDHEEYIGKKCHKVLQGLDTPCSFCNNKKLEYGKFISWTYKNPVLNKSFLIKDSIIKYNGRDYRIEIAIDIDSDSINNQILYNSRAETILHKCLLHMVSTPIAEESISQVFKYIGETFLCDRVFIFELHDSGLMSNTYEWCAKDVAPQAQVLQNESTDSVDWWIDSFKENNKIVIIENLEAIRTKHPVTYSLLKPQNITSLAVAPIYIEGKLQGFFGVDNPKEDMLHLITPLFTAMGYFISSLLQRRSLLNKLNYMGYHDSLTGALNRNSLNTYNDDAVHKDSIGIIYCDITALKQTNDSLGHNAGDIMIKECYKLICDSLKTDLIYRTGGDEFVCILPDFNEDDFNNAVENLKNSIKRFKHHIAIGYTWSNQKPIDLENLISKADNIMYLDKRKYYDNNNIDRRKSTNVKKNESTLFNQFVANNCFDSESFFTSLTQENSSSYFFFGDMQKNQFYISDNMRDEFGFDSNIVYDLITKWSSCISTAKFQEMYWDEMNDILHEKRTVHNLCYQVRNVNGKYMWVRCYGVIKWDNEKEKPLFFSGRVNYQDETLVVDPITNFPRQSMLYKHLYEFKESESKHMFIGFGLNNITEINNTLGRGNTDSLLKNIADMLMAELSNKMSFYRLEGVRFIAVINPEYNQNVDELIEQIRNIISICYNSIGFAIHNISSFAIMKYPYQYLKPEDFIENIDSLIKEARHEPDKAYIKYSSSSIQKIKQMSSMELTLNQDVLNNMHNFRIVVQPVVSAKNGKIKGGEVLLRWKFEGNDISPGIFVPILEKGDLINTVGRWVFEQTVRTCNKLIAHMPDCYISFNVSLQQLTDLGFTEFMKETLNKYYLDGSHLVAEMTESYMDSHPPKLNQFVDECNKMNIRIALDDFGTGYSSMRMLLQYPCNIIKLDRSLLIEMTHSDKSKQFISSLVYACHQFGKIVCIEGVETQEQINILKDLECDLIQGYYYYKPMELNDLYSVFS